MKTLFMLEICLFLSLMVLLVSSHPCKFGPGCKFKCHCSHNDTCNQETGQCPHGCDGGQPREGFNSGQWSGDGCQFGNVAFGKKVSAGPFIKRGTYPANSVDGDIRQHRNKLCSFTYSYLRQLPSWWQVDLGGPHVIYNLTIVLDKFYYNPSWSAHWDVFVGPTHKYVNHDLCAHLSGTFDVHVQYSESEQRMSVICLHPITGQYVTIAVERHVYRNNLLLCEVYVYGFQVEDCEAGMWGPGCLTSCNCSDGCNPATGVCEVADVTKDDFNKTLICAEGQYGRDCGQQCSCKDPEEVCDKETGYCPLSGCAEWNDNTGCRKLPTITALLFLSTTHDSVEMEFIQWQATVDETAPPTWYQVNYRVFGSPYWTPGIRLKHTLDGSAVSFVQTGLEPNTSYELRVISKINSTLPGKPSQVSIFKTDVPSVSSHSPPYMTILMITLIIVMVLLGITTAIYYIMKTFTMWSRRRDTAGELSSPSLRMNKHVSGRSIDYVFKIANQFEQQQNQVNENVCETKK